MLIFGEGVPLAGLQPEGVAADPQFFMAGGDRRGQFLLPSSDNGFHSMVETRQIPFVPRKDLDPTVRQCVRDRLHQRGPGIVLSNRIGYRPDAALLVFQADPEIGDEGIERIPFGFVENADVSAPRHVAQRLDAGNPCRCRHRRGLSFQDLDAPIHTLPNTLIIS